MTPFPTLQPYVRRDLAVLADLPEVQARIAAAMYRAADLANTTFPGSGTEAAQIIHMSIRALTPADAKTALDRLLQEAEQRGRNKALREAAETILNDNPDFGDDGICPHGTWEGYACRECLAEKVSALIQEAPHDPA
jgi:hypothetical protein